MQVNSFQVVLIDVTLWLITCLKGGTDCGNNWVKNPIYTARAVKGLNVHLNRTDSPQSHDWVHQCQRR